MDAVCVALDLSAERKVTKKQTNICGKKITHDLTVKQFVQQGWPLSRLSQCSSAFRMAGQQVFCHLSPMYSQCFHVARLKNSRP